MLSERRKKLQHYFVTKEWEPIVLQKHFRAKIDRDAKMTRSLVSDCTPRDAAEHHVEEDMTDEVETKLIKPPRGSTLRRRRIHFPPQLRRSPYRINDSPEYETDLDTSSKRKESNPVVPVIQPKSIVAKETVVKEPRDSRTVQKSVSWSNETYVDKKASVTPDVESKKIDMDTLSNRQVPDTPDTQSETPAELVAVVPHTPETHSETAANLNAVVPDTPDTQSETPTVLETMVPHTPDTHSETAANLKAVVPDTPDTQSETPAGLETVAANTNQQDGEGIANGRTFWSRLIRGAGAGVTSCMPDMPSPEVDSESQREGNTSSAGLYESDFAGLAEGQDSRVQVVAGEFGVEMISGCEPKLGSDEQLSICDLPNLESSSMVDVSLGTEKDVTHTKSEGQCQTHNVETVSETSPPKSEDQCHASMNAVSPSKSDEPGDDFPSCYELLCLFAGPCSCDDVAYEEEEDDEDLDEALERLDGSRNSRLSLASTSSSSSSTSSTDTDDYLSISTKASASTNGAASCEPGIKRKRVVVLLDMMGQRLMGETEVAGNKAGNPSNTDGRWQS